jgi:tungstate transport system ATP-binding protein
MRATISPLPISFRDVAWRVGATDVLTGIDLGIGAGAPTVIVGPNGSGKTTLLRIAMGLTAPTSGRVTYGGHAAARPPRAAFVFQRPVMLRRTASANVAFALSAAGRSPDEAAIARLLERVGLAHVATRPARRLSGGEQQRLALARALACDPEVLFLDEPTASLDPHQTKAVEDIVVGAAAAGLKIVMSTHDLGQARRLAGDLVVLVAGRIAEHGDAAQVFTAPASEAARRFLAGDLVV